MKKTTFLKTLLVAACLLVGSNDAWAVDDRFIDALSTSTGTVGLEDNTNTYWQYHSMEYVVPSGKTYDIEFTNYTAGIGNYQNFNVVINNGTATYNDLGGIEYLFLRNDNYGWGTYYNVASISNGFINNNTDIDDYWTAYRAAMDGANVKLSVTHLGDNFYITAVITPTNTSLYPQFTYSYAATTIPGLTDFGFSLTIEGGHLIINNAELKDVPSISYDFTSFSNQSLTSSGITPIKNNGAAVYIPSQFTSELGSRFAFQYRPNNTWSITTSYGGGLWAYCGSGNDEYISILNLKAGDVVTITNSSGWLFCSVANQIRGTYYASNSDRTSGTCTTGTVPQWGILISGNSYTMIADGALHLQAKKYSYANAHAVIKNIVIQTLAEETVTAPAISFAVSGTSRVVTITPGISSISSGVTTYYTTDGTTPTSSSTKYTGAFNLDATATVKAITISNSTIETVSDVVTQEIEAGTAVTLNAPMVAMDLNASDDIYVPTYTFASDQSDVLGVPNAIITYAVDGGDATTGTTYTPVKACTIVVTASAEGYTSTQTSFTVNSVAYNKIATLDFSSSTYASDTKFTAGSTKKGTAYNSSNNVTNNIYNITYPETLADYLAFQGVAGASDVKGWYIRNSNGNVGLWSGGAARAALFLGRTEGQVVAFNCTQAASNVMTYLNGNGVPDGNYTMLPSANGKNYYATMTADGNIGFCGKSNSGYMSSIVIYEPLTASKTISSAGWATYCSPYPLDFSSSIDNLEAAYIITNIESNQKTLVLSEITTTVPANTGLLLKGEGNVAIPVVGSSSTDVSGNKLTGVTTATTLDLDDNDDGTADDYIYVLMDGGNGVGFYKTTATSFNLGANTAYLPSGFADGMAREFFLFEDDGTTTGIADVRSKMSDVRGDVFDLQGRKVNGQWSSQRHTLKERMVNGQLPKGLYIVNGKKVVIK